MDNLFIYVDEIASEIGISKSYAYKIVQRLNKELQKLGYLTFAGRVSRKFFMEKVCYNGQENKERK